MRDPDGTVLSGDAAFSHFPYKEVHIMDGLLTDVVEKSFYALEPRVLENDIVRVEASVRCIRIGIKNADDTVFSRLEVAYPFKPAPVGLEQISQGRWFVAPEFISETEMRYAFKNRDEEHELTLRIADPSARPMLVDVSWK